MDKATLLQCDRNTLQGWCSKCPLSLHPIKFREPNHIEYNLVVDEKTTGIERVEWEMDSASCCKIASKLVFNIHINETKNNK